MFSPVSELDLSAGVSELNGMLVEGDSSPMADHVVNTESASSKSSSDEPSTKSVYLVRYGSVPEVARFRNESDDEPTRGAMVVVKTHRGLQIGSVLERLKPAKGLDGSDVDFEIVRVASGSDLETARQRTDECETTFADWRTRIVEWGLQLELIDLEWTLDRDKLIFYVLCERGPDSTKLALQAAASGFGIIEVQPVSATGLVSLPPASSCGSGGGGGGGGCGCSH